MVARYYKMSIDMRDPEFMNSIEGGDDLGGIRASADIHGEPIADFPAVSFRMAGKKVTDCLRNRSMWPLFSERLKAIVEEAELTGCEFHPVTVTHVKGVPLGRYWYFNVLKTKGALDLDRTPHRWIGPPKARMLVVFRPVLMGSAIKGLDFFRIEETTAAMFTSQRFVDLYRANKCTGLSFREVAVV